jgi:hypothetical protein
MKYFLIARVLLLPLLVMVSGALLCMVLVCLIGFGASSIESPWRFLGIVSVPDTMKGRIIGATIAVMLLVLFVYAFQIADLIRTLRRHKMSLAEFAALSGLERRALASNERQKQR